MQTTSKHISFYSVFTPTIPRAVTPPEWEAEAHQMFSMMCVTLPISQFASLDEVVSGAHVSYSLITGRLQQLHLKCFRNIYFHVSRMILVNSIFHLTMR
jgi:hypothetical protein